MKTKWNLFWALIILSYISFAASFYIQKPIIERKTITTALSLQTPTPKKTPLVSPTIFLSTITPTKTPTTPPTGTQKPTIAKAGRITQLQVTVSITGLPNFSLSIPPDLNHCDVLNQALQQGKIRSVNMKYDTTYKTYGVYQINEIGKENQVWWTYKVNEKAPPLGCSYVKVNNNDSISWIYVGPN